MAYKVELEAYEGPMDLLLFLVRKHDIDIFDIPVAKITSQFLEYIQFMRMLDLDVAGDFLSLASTLVRIKARMLLPKESEEEEDGDEDDPRAQLARSLLEYQEYKKLADNLYEKQEDQRNIFYRNLGLDPDDEKEHEILDVSLFDLLAAFKEAMEAAPDEIFHQVEREEISLSERIEFVRQYLTDRKKVTFFDMFPKGTHKGTLVVTFMAMLELIKQQFLRIGQSGSFGEIWIYLREQSVKTEQTQTEE